MSATDLHDPATERMVLGAMLLEPSVAAEVAEIITAADYYRPAHAVIHAAVLGAIDEGAPSDPVAIATRLAQQGDLERAGGAPYLHDLIVAVDVAASAPWHARHMRELSQRRALAAFAIKTHQRVGNLENDFAAAVNAIQADLHAATTSRLAHEPVAFGDGLDQLIEEICDPIGPDRGLSTGIGALDDVIGGLKPGQLVIVGGRPGSGKSVLGLDMIRASAIRRGLPCLVISLEMSIAEVRKRVMAAECGVDLHRVINGGLRYDEIQRLRAQAPRLGRTPVLIEDNGMADLAGIRAHARRAMQRSGLHLLVVDYLQLMTSTITTDSRTQEIGAISRGLKVLARELNIPIVAMAQLNRASETRSDKRPQLSDLRESGSIEADADVVILLHRPDYHDPGHIRAGEIDLIVSKNRNGRQETVTATAQLQFARIVDLIPGGGR